MIRLCALLPAPTPDEALRMAERLRLWGTGVAFPAGATEADAAALGRRCADAGVRIVQVTDYQNVSTPVEEVRREAVQRLRRSMALAAAAGARAVCTGAGHCDPARPRETFAAHQDNFSDAALDRLANACRDVVAAGEVRGGGVRLLVETWVMTPLNSLLRAAEAVRRVADPAFGILFDPVNLMSLDNYFDNGSFLRRCVQQLGPAIGLVHAKDTLLHPERFTFQLAEEPIGKGALDYPALLQALAALPGDVPVCVEHLRTEEEVAAAIAHLRGVADRVGVRLG
jgi:L-ribulose-5-phosphate 3-epimerase